MSFRVPKIGLWFRRIFPAVILGALVLLSGAPKAKANDWDDCNRRIAYARWQLHESIENFGYDSRQARHWRHELHEEYEKQDHLRRKYHYERDYDGEYYRQRHRWYEDDHDRDRDRDRYYRRDVD
jgi:hypothetical protein